MSRSPLDRSQSLFYFVPQEKILTVKLTRLDPPYFQVSQGTCDYLWSSIFSSLVQLWLNSNLAQFEWWRNVTKETLITLLNNDVILFDNDKSALAFVWLFFAVCIHGSSNCLPKKMRGHIGCICSAFLHNCILLKVLFKWWRNMTKETVVTVFDDDGQFVCLIKSAPFKLWRLLLLISDRLKSFVRGFYKIYLGFTKSQNENGAKRPNN